MRPPLAVLPHRSHGKRVLAHGNGNPEFRTEIHRNRGNRVVQVGILARFATGAHPVGRQLDVADRPHGSGGQVGQGLADRHAAGCRCVEQRQRGALAHGHGLARDGAVTGGGHGAVRNRQLVGADHLVAVHHSRHRTIGDGNQEGLVGHGRQLEHAGQRIH